MQRMVNEIISPLTLADIYDKSVTLTSDGDKLTHLQFRRFAGCPICNLHIHSFFQRADDLAQANIQSVIVFHASQQRMLEHVVDVNEEVKTELQANFSLIADPQKKLYSLFGLENTWKSLLHPKVISSALKGVMVKRFVAPEKLETEFVVPADFLIDAQGKIVAMKYGKHADDQWSVDELLSYTERL